jgi:NTE family protein
MKLTEWWNWVRRRIRRPEPREPAIGLALGGGFARGIAHIGVLRVFEQHRIPLKYIAGVSAGSIVAAAFASGRSADEIAGFAGHMRFRDVARWTLSRMGLMDSDRMEAFLKKLLNVYTFEQMRIPLAVVATDLTAAKPVVFRDRGEVFVPIRASCAYPGLFRPIRYEGRYLVDGAITMEIPSLPLREMGATHVVAVVLPMQTPLVDPQNLFRVVNQCFQILQARTEWEWRRHSDVVIVPEVGGAGWDSFQDSEKLIEAGERAARAALPAILSWLSRPRAALASSRPVATRS